MHSQQGQCISNALECWLQASCGGLLLQMGSVVAIEAMVLTK
jgi:hypothetical protein